MARITIENSGTIIEARPGQSLLISLIHEDQPIHTVCGGHAQCGCCRVRILSGAKGLSPARDNERKRLGTDSLEDGWRLACQTHMLRDVTIHLPVAEDLDTLCSP